MPYDLKPCPFCGGEAFMDSCDRSIRIGCKICNYALPFHGLIQSEINTGKPVMYTGGKISEDEWYDRYAYERATEKWNRRQNDSNS